MSGLLQCLIESKIIKFLKIHKIDNSIFKQNQKINTKIKRQKPKISLILQHFTLVIIHYDAKHEQNLYFKGKTLLLN